MLKHRQWIYHGRIIDLSVDEVALPNGAEAHLERVHHPGGAAVTAIDDHGRVCLLRQYRHAIEEWIWELPAGKLGPGEPAQEAAVRELAEEAGVEAGQWSSLGTILPSPGVLDERIGLFLATGLSPVPAGHEAHEVIEIHWLGLDEARTMIERGEIIDAKTVIGLGRGLQQWRHQSGNTSSPGGLK